MITSKGNCHAIWFRRQGIRCPISVKESHELKAIGWDFGYGYQWPFPMINALCPRLAHGLSVVYHGEVSWWGNMGSKPHSKLSTQKIHSIATSYLQWLVMSKQNILYSTDRRWHHLRTTSLEGRCCSNCWGLLSWYSHVNLWVSVVFRQVANTEWNSS